MNRKYLAVFRHKPSDLIIFLQTQQHNTACSRRLVYVSPTLQEYSYSDNFNVGEDDDDEGCNSDENKTFWQQQEQHLQATLYRTSSIETKIRQATNQALKEVRSKGLLCLCRRPVTGGCRNCLREEVSRRLRDAGYDCVISKSKWTSSNDIPAGEHKYLEIVEKSGSKKGEIRVVIELSFRAEFEMARGCEEYKRLVGTLPEAYVGKTERLRSLIKILCTAAKKCMEDKKMHLAPWRRQKYMQAKWLGTCERQSVTPILEIEPKTKQRVSMLKNGLYGDGLGRPAAVAVV